MTAANDRDLVGFGRSRPRPPWRERSPLALSLVLNYEEGAERTVLNDDATSETYVHELTGIEGRAGSRDLNTESLYGYGARAGVWRILRLFEELDVTATVFGVGKALALNPEVGRQCARQGLEIASHNWRWFDYADVAEDIEREHILKAKDTIRELTGQPPVGFYCGRVSANSRRLAIACGGLLYDSDAYDDDIPYWLELEDGGRHLVIPYALDTNDMKFAPRTASPRRRPLPTISARPSTSCTGRESMAALRCSRWGSTAASSEGRRVSRRSAAFWSMS